MKKRGAGHVEILISFVLFIGFIGLAFFFFNPSNSSRVVSSALDYTLIEVSDSIITSVDFYGIKHNSSCNSTIGVNIGSETIGKNVRAFKPSGGTVPSSISGNFVFIDFQTEDFINIVLSEEIAAGIAAGVGDTDDFCYEIASTDSREIFSEKKANALVSTYDLDYNSLKEQFNLLSRMDFSFELVLPSKSITASKEIPQDLEVFSDVESKETITEQGELVFADLIVKIW
tara:strand:- start:212 stop:901 length:690 start_codon:yes stop_codon:yes gene_type:complete